MKTKGALIWDFHQPWSIEEIEIGEPRRGEVKIRMAAAGLCHSDHHLVTGDIPMASFPILGGHEGAGVVVEVGAGVDDIAVGDHVALSFIPACGRCPSCRAGRTNLCDLGAGLLAGASVSDGSFRVRARGQDVYPMSLLGTFSPYLVVHRSSVVKIDPEIPFEVACLLSCGVTTGFGAVARSAEVRPGEDVAVIGIGGLGASAVQAAALAGARYVFAIDPVPWKREQALHFGATHAYPDVTAALAAVPELTAGGMAAKVIVTVGRMDGRDLDMYLALTAKAGTCVVVAMGGVLESETTLNLSMLTLFQKNVQGTIFGAGNPQHDIPRLLALYRAGRLNLDDMVTRTYRLEDVNDGYRDMLEGRNIRGVITFTDADR
ncbi:NDMA-dependent alcohol dehydrogenase [Nocardia sp. NPDC057227]|uniref:NDMA-dependent alcohol dehydrogenase n=1 Tax=Nocardia sp. NPDC057227 TaxID=3346056 RepID=UPI0036385C74